MLETFTLDIGGEGRNREAWNLNPKPTKTLNPNRGQPIPRHISGRADAIPLPDQCVDRIIMERTPLNRAAIIEMLRVIAAHGEIILRHAVPPRFDPHALARKLLPGYAGQRNVQIGGHTLRETRFRLGG